MSGSCRDLAQRRGGEVRACARSGAAPERWQGTRPTSPPDWEDADFISNLSRDHTSILAVLKVKP